MPADEKPYTQEDRILCKLRAAPGQGWVSAWVLAQISLQYNARILALRRRGFKIISRVEVSGHNRRGFFRLISAISPRRHLEPAPSSGKTDNLFGEVLEPDQTYRE
jgi:hypothetical protein